MFLCLVCQTPIPTLWVYLNQIFHVFISFQNVFPDCQKINKLLFFFLSTECGPIPCSLFICVMDRSSFKSGSEVQLPVESSFPADLSGVTLLLSVALSLDTLHGPLGHSAVQTQTNSSSTLRHCSIHFYKLGRKWFC